MKAAGRDEAAADARQKLLEAEVGLLLSLPLSLSLSLFFIRFRSR